MKALKKLGIVTLTLCTVMTATGFYMFKIEPSVLRVKEVTPHFASSENTEELKVVQFSDTHLGDHYTLKQLEKLVKRINMQKPDLVLFTGDLMDRAASYEEQDEAAAILGNIQARIGKYAVWGNHDYGGGGVRVYANMIATAGFTLLENTSEILNLSEDKTLEITGLDDAMLGEPDLSILDEQEGDFRVLMMHEPDQVSEMENAEVDLILSGHSHGGQIFIPGKGALVKTPMAELYSRGLYELGFAKLYVNPGIGTTKVSVRFMNPPEITVFQLKI